MVVVDTSLFEGEECEGKFRGVSTLFVAGEVPYDIIRKQFDKKTYGQIYFGAGRLWRIDYTVVKKVLAKHLAPIVMIETPDQIPLKLFDDRRVFAMIPEGASIGLFMYYWSVRDRVQIRVNIGDEEFFVFPLSSAIRNNTHDYNEDILIWSE